MQPRKLLGSGTKVLIFLTAFAVVVLFNAFVAPEIMQNATYWFRTGDYLSLAIVLAETFALGMLFRMLLVWAFKMQFERR